MRTIGSVAVFLVSGVSLFAADWPQWLGPNRNASSTEKVAAWKDAPKALWRATVGEGHSSPIVVGDRVFLHSKGEGNTEVVTCFDAKSGDEIWKKSYKRGDFSSEFGNGPRATPAVAGKRLYTFGVTGILTCFELEKGEQVWQVDTLKDFKATNLKFGMSGSPLVDDGKVFVNVGAKGASVIAFDAENGKPAWKALDDGASYSSPIAFGEGKQREVVFFTAAGLVALKPADGTVLWKFPLVDDLLESSTTPVLLGDRLLAGSITYGSVLLKLATEDDKPTATKSWRNEKLTNYFTTPVAVDKDHVYMVAGIPIPGLARADLHCVDLSTGKSLWKREKVGKYHATLLRTGNDKLLLLEEAGSLVLVDPNPEKYVELARSKICGETWAHPALANGKLYVRDAKELICLELP
jgi:outer membrane protein assembly factor BamB